MERVVVRVRPIEVMDDLDLDVVERRLRGLSEWAVEVDDTRLTDATYVTVVAEHERIDEASITRLREALADLPRMRALLWRRSAPEVPLESAPLSAFVDAAADT